jgi:transcription elongation factor Elf1
MDMGGGREGRRDSVSVRVERGRWLFHCVRCVRVVVSCRVLCNFEGERARGVEVLDVCAQNHLGDYAFLSYYLLHFLNFII